MNYRPGAIGAMTDEYEKALNELKVVLKSISDELFLKTNLDAEKTFSIDSKHYVSCNSFRLCVF
jgi:hypothetical protein